MQKPTRFREVLNAATISAIKAEAVLGTLDPRSAVVVIPQRSIRRPFPRSLQPPIPAMLNVGRGAADVRVRLYLWLWAVTSARKPAPYRRTTGEWAQLLNLLGRPTVPRERAAAARRVSSALAYLADGHLVRRTDRDTTRLLDPDGSGADFEPWTDEQMRAREVRRRELAEEWGDAVDFRITDVWEDAPLRIPVALWLNGTISALPGPALASLLVLLDHQRRSDEDVIWVPKSRTHQYCIGPDSWRAGLHVLEQFGCIHRVYGARILAPGVNSKAPEGRRRVGWKIDERRLYGLRRERY